MSSHFTIGDSSVPRLEAVVVPFFLMYPAMLFREAARPCLEIIDANQDHEGDDHQHGGNRRGPQVIISFQPFKNEHRRDLSFVLNVSGNKDNRSILADGPRK